MPKIERKITLAGETEALTALNWGSTSSDVIQLELHNLSSVDTIENIICAVRGDLLEGTANTSESQGVKNGIGVELCINRWLEVRLDAADVWHAVDSFANGYDIGAIAAGASKTFEVRLNVPGTYDSLGTIAFAIRVLSR